MPGRRRADSLSATPDDRAKRLKTDHKHTDHTACFATGLLSSNTVSNLHDSYKSSGPFLHVVVDKLLQNDLLSKVKDECLGELSFSEKETDIYKVHQTGDLASLSYLAEAQIALLPNLLKLRDALYSEEFRTFLRKVTGCGPLSGKKQDMSVNSYRKGCHLLNHDDVIGSRCVSYILYMPTPEDQPWMPEWGGALELYPVKIGPDGTEEPESIPSKSIPPSWNQFTFFEVQPGHSFHSVEEVVVGEGSNQRQRLSISGWFHRAQEGEEGYEPESVEERKSSREQLGLTSTIFTPYVESHANKIPSDTLTAEQTAFLSSFLNPVYLQPKVLKTLGKKFLEESSLELHNFLAGPIAKKLESGLKKKDREDKLDFDSRKGRVPPHIAGASVSKGKESEWAIQGPPHKARYCTLNLPSSSSSKRNNAQDPIAILSAADSTPAQVMQVLEQTLFPSTAFRAWLYIVAVLITEKYSVKARRFRPGLDYTLATSDNTQSILDVVLGLTPDFEKKDKGKGRAIAQDDDDEDWEGWEKGDWGGWECYMAPHDGDDDPAVYKSHSSREKASETNNGHSNGASNGHGHSTGANGAGFDSSNSKTRSPAKNGNGNGNGYLHALADADEEGDEDEENEEDEDGTLLTVYPGFNRLMLALRDEGVLRFTKYVSAAAPGSVWDVSAEYEVVMTDDRGDEEDGSGVSTPESMSSK